MKKYLAFAFALMMFSLTVYASETVISNLNLSVSETREYSINIAPGELLFTELRTFSGGTYTYTNNSDYMWYPCRIEVWYPSSVNSTNTLYHIARSDEYQYLEYQVVTNDFGLVATNYMHALTNTVTTYLTNAITSWTNSGTYSVGSMDDTKEHFFKRGDLFKFTSGTNAVWLRYSGRR